MGIASQAVQRERREREAAEQALELAEIEIQNLPRKQGDPIGCLQWTDFRTGQTRRWVIRIGARIDQVTLHAPDGRATSSHGWTWVMNRLRSCIVRGSG